MELGQVWSGQGAADPESRQNGFGVYRKLKCLGVARWAWSHLPISLRWGIPEAMFSLSSSVVRNSNL